jgi:hypothetical protein
MIHDIIYFQEATISTGYKMGRMSKLTKIILLPDGQTGKLALFSSGTGYMSIVAGPQIKILGSEIYRFRQGSRGGGGEGSGDNKGGKV